VSPNDDDDDDAVPVFYVKQSQVDEDNKPFTRPAALRVSIAIVRKLIPAKLYTDTNGDISGI
jgi:hypothetical protein